MDKSIPKEIIIPYSPHDGQIVIHNSKARFKVIVCGRRWGKTTASINELIKAALIKKDARVWYISPSYRQSKMVAFKMIKQFLPEELIERINQVELTFYLKNGSEISLKGADSEDTLRGVGLDFAVLDEFASMKGNVWPEIVRPMLIDSGGKAIFIGTPKGRNHFYDLYLDGLNDEEEDWQSFQYPTSSNKYIPAEEISAAEKDMSVRLFSQEFKASFIDDETSVFKGIRKCAVSKLREPKEGRFYVMGVDLAKHQDFTVLWVMDAVKRETVAFERFQEISWNEQKARIIRLAEKYNNAYIWIDSTGVGEPIFEDLEAAGCSIEGYKFTNPSKAALIENLQIALEQRLILIPNIDVIMKEFIEFGYSYSEKTHKIIYEAPSGKHDDCVIGCALAAWGIRNYIKSAQMVIPRPVDEEDVVDKQGHGELVNTNIQTERQGY